MKVAGRIGGADRDFASRQDGPVSSPASISMAQIPVDPSPAAMARWIGRHRASAAAARHGR